MQLPLLKPGSDGNVEHYYRYIDGLPPLFGLVSTLIIPLELLAPPGKVKSTPAKLV